MTIRNTATTWGRPTKLLHWIMAVLILGIMGLGIYVHDFETDRARALELITLHKSWGFVAFWLVVARIAWRLYAGTPELPTGIPRWQVVASRISHGLLYALMVIMPLSGWLFTSASPAQERFGIRNVVFGLFEMPDPFMPGVRWVAELFGTVHFVSAKLLMALVIIHVAAALKHHFIDRDAVLRRMWF